MIGRVCAVSGALACTMLLALPAVAAEKPSKRTYDEQYYGPSHGTELGVPPDADVARDYVDEDAEHYSKKRTAPKRYAEGYGNDYDGSYDAPYDYDDKYDRRSYRRSYKDDLYAEPLDRAPRRSYKDGPIVSYKDGPLRYAERCVRRRDIRRGLRYDGWRSLRGYDDDGDLISLSARRRDTGRRYELELDSCTGLILSAVPIGHAYPLGPRFFAGRHFLGPRNYRRPGLRRGFRRGLRRSPPGVRRGQVQQPGRIIQRQQRLSRRGAVPPRRQGPPRRSRFVN